MTRYVVDDGCCPHGALHECPVPAALDAAWAEAEAALPDGWNVTLYSHRLTGTFVAYATDEGGMPVNSIDLRGTDLVPAAQNAATPAAALHALALALAATTPPAPPETETE